MNYKYVSLLVIILLILFGTTFAQKTVNDFKIDEQYNKAYAGFYQSIFLNKHNDSGIAIFQKNPKGIEENASGFGHLIHKDPKDYFNSSEYYKLSQNKDGSYNFTDREYGEHGIVEVVSYAGESYIVVFWAKEYSNVHRSELHPVLINFNKINNLSIVQ